MDRGRQDIENPDLLLKFYFPVAYTSPGNVLFYLKTFKLILLSASSIIPPLRVIMIFGQGRILYIYIIQIGTFDLFYKSK